MNIGNATPYSHSSAYLIILFLLPGYVVHNADELEKIMAVGNKNRVIGATAMNTESSRSHAIFSITVESSKRGADGKMHVKMGKLHLVDLAVRLQMLLLITTKNRQEFVQALIGYGSVDTRNCMWI